MVNILRQPWENHSVRFYLASLNRSLIVSEPVLPHLLLDQRGYYVETPLDRMAETIHQ